VPVEVLAAAMASATDYAQDATMTTAQWILNAGLLGWVLLSNLGTRPVTRSTYLLPLLVVAVAGIIFLRHLPTAGNDGGLDAVGAVTGVLLGVLATALTRICRDHAGAAIITAGPGLRRRVDHRDRRPDGIRRTGHPRLEPRGRRVLDPASDHWRRRLDRLVRPHGP
jgi:hypothetical protein